ncbi:hypothetical protein F5Y15DRAFT_55400 [Xylariaceae sp. FL0016]|nr:hypothetical protein F5Y15DRAFT_55400 [Xylariaceae sp. FL0016]
MSATMGPPGRAGTQIEYISTSRQRPQTLDAVVRDGQDSRPPVPQSTAPARKVSSPMKSPTSVYSPNNEDRPEVALQLRPFRKGPASSPESPGALTVKESNHGRKKTHSPEVWETLKSDITRLYIDENKRLKDVMEIMEKTRGFRASQKMYKTKLTQWKLFKNNRQADVANLLYLQRHRQAIGKESTFRRNGKMVDIEAYMRRKGLRANDLLEVAEPGDLPPTLRCRTPPSLPMQIEPPDDLRAQQVIIQWQTHEVAAPPHIDVNVKSLLDMHHQSEAMHSVTLLTHACWLFALGRVDEGGEVCRKGFGLANHILEDPASFSIFELWQGLLRYPNPDVIKSLWNYLLQYLATTNGQARPLYRMLEALSGLSQTHKLEDTLDTVKWGLRLASGLANGLFDGRPFDYTMVKPWDLLPLEDSYHRYYILNNSWEVDTIPTATIPSVAEFQSPWSLRADLLLIFGNQTEWRDERISTVALKLLAQMRASPSPHSKYLEFISLYATARNNRTRADNQDARTSLDHKLAREYLQKAADIQKEAWRPGKNYYETLTLLQEWHREAGDETAADAIQRRLEMDCMKVFPDRVFLIED